MKALRCLLILSLLAPRSVADQENLLPKCQSALSACKVLVERQDAHIVLLKDSLKAYKKELDGPRRDVPLVVWTVVAGGLGGAIGGKLTGDTNGLAVGGIVGVGVGLVIGLIGN